MSFHNVHVSVTQIEYNEVKQSTRLIIRVFADDLENALSQHTKRTIKIDATSDINKREIGQMLIVYLRLHLELKNKSGRQVKLEWVDLEGDGAVFWLYVEGKMPGGLEGTQLKNRIFCELFDDQVNIVNATLKGKKIGLMFETKDEFKVITERITNK